MGDTGADIMEPLTDGMSGAGPQDKRNLGAGNASGNTSGGASGNASGNFSGGASGNAYGNFSGRKPPAPKVLVLAIIVGILLLAGVLVAGILPRLNRQAELNKHAEVIATTKRTIAVVKAVKDKGKSSFTLPANLEPIQEIPIYARCDGYLKERLVDIGDVVKVGQVLAVIDAPELDKQLEQARADLRQANSQVKSNQADLAHAQSVLMTAKASVRRLQANLAFSKRQLGRYEELADEGAISREQRDEKQRDLDADLAAIQAARAEVDAADAQVSSAREKIEVARGAVASAQANLERNQTTQNFRYVKSPCNGVVTARNVDAGALVSEGSANSVQSLLTIARTDELRVFVAVPQMMYRKVSVGTSAHLEVAEMPGRTFQAVVAKVSGGLDAASRTMLVQVRIPNGEHILKPGMYGTIVFDSLTSTDDGPGSVPVLIPASALIVRPTGQFVAVVDANDKVHMQVVSTGRDYGRQIEVLKGLIGGETIVLDPDVDLKDGAVIKPELKAMRAD